MKNSSQKIMIPIAALLMVSVFQNCGSKVGFSGDGSEALSSVDPNATPSPTPVPTMTPAATPVPVAKSKTFTSAANEKHIDMVWVIDNSRSMPDNIAQVRNNLKAFAATLKTGTDIKLALISRGTEMSKSDTSISLPDDLGIDHVQIDYFVDSYNSLLIGAAASCPPAPASDDKLCKTLKANARYARVYGGLNSFYRADSQKVFVVVSDDDSAYKAQGNEETDQMPKSPDPIDKKMDLVENSDFITSATFKTQMARNFGDGAIIKFFGFVHNAAEKEKCAAREGANYEASAANFSGATYEICTDDWSEHFTDLTKAVVDSAATTYSLGNVDLQSVDSVTLNGVKLKLKTDYTVSGTVITLNKDLVAQAGKYTIVVKYTVLETP